MKKRNENLLILAAAAGITALSCAIAEVIAGAVRAKRGESEEPETETAFAEAEDFETAEGAVEETAETVEEAVEAVEEAEEAPAEAE